MPFFNVDGWDRTRIADLIREHYDHVEAESIAWNMEIKFGLHGNYAE